MKRDNSKKSWMLYIDNGLFAYDAQINDMNSRSRKKSPLEENYVFLSGTELSAGLAKPPALL